MRKLYTGTSLAPELQAYSYTHTPNTQHPLI